MLAGSAVACISCVRVYSEKTRDLNKDLKKIYRLFPPYLMSDNLIQLALIDLLNPAKGVWEITRTNMLFAGAECGVYLLIVMAMDYINSFPSILAKLGFVVDGTHCRHSMKSSMNSTEISTTCSMNRSGLICGVVFRGFNSG